ncbi:MAG: pimeloyl-ACP methyl ester carboxylesterase [Candidatus Azotimanducaceae bacterium]|jgi:pimeloyl-ACP methyl ester carboxylesterase
MSQAIVRTFELNISDAQLTDLKQRLAATRFPEAETPDDWSQGVPLSYAQELTTYWLEEYDWRAREAYYNRFPQFKVNLQGLDIHFLHVKSPVKDARPLLMTHGWPGSVVEFHKIVEPLTNPELHGGSAADAFHVVAPSLPGYGFSDKPTEPGWGVEKIAEVWDELMRAAGYEVYFAQGGDWGSAVTTAIGLQDRGACKGIHVNMPNARATKEALADPQDDDKRALAGAKYYQEWGAGYSKQQSTRPQTLGYGLVDSPVGQAMWIIEKFYEWTDCQGHPENVLTKDELLDNVMFYWWQGNGASSGRLYWESFNQAFGSDGPTTVSLPTGCSIFPKEIVPTPRSWAEKRYTNIVYWNELSAGGHFAAFEQPELFVNEIRTCFSLFSLD